MSTSILESFAILTLRMTLSPPHSSGTALNAVLPQSAAPVDIKQ